MKKFCQLIVIIAMFIFTSCKDDGVINTPKGGGTLQSEEFCQFVSEENFELTIPIINNFLKKLETNLSWAEKLEKLCDWLEEHDCVLSAEKWNGFIIKTLPEQTHLYVTFKTQNGFKQLALCITLSNPLVLGRFHYEED